MRISDWSSDVCSSDLGGGRGDRQARPQALREAGHEDPDRGQGDGGEEEQRQRDATIEDKAGKKSEITVDRIISAVGVQGNIENLGQIGSASCRERVCKSV